MAEVSINSEFLGKVHRWIFPGQKLWKDAAPLNGKTFSSTISRLSIKRWRILFDFPLASVLPLIFTFSLLLRLTWNPWIETGVTVRRTVTRIPPCRYIFRVYLRCRYIFRIYFREPRLRRPVSIVFADSLVSSELLRKRVGAKRTSQKKERIISHLLLPFREASRIFPVSLLPAQRFPACDMAGLLILIIDRGIIKVAFARGRFQLRISVSLGTIGPVSRKEKEKG